METYVDVLAGIGALIPLTAWLPMVLRALALSLAICCVGTGAPLPTMPSLADLLPHPARCQAPRKS